MVEVNKYNNYATIIIFVPLPSLSLSLPRSLVRYTVSGGGADAGSSTGGQEDAHTGSHR